MYVYILYLSLEPTQVESVEVLSSFYYIVWLWLRENLCSALEIPTQKQIAHYNTE